MPTEERIVYSILGRDIGTGTAWDSLEQNAVIIYEFVPGPTLKGILPECDLGIYFDKGTFEQYDPDNGTLLQSWDIIPTIMHLPKLED